MHKDFHKYCDRKGSNLVLFLTDTNRWFAGYTSKSWLSQSKPDLDELGHTQDKNAFLFSLDNFQVFPVQFFPAAINRVPTSGPIFGK